MEGTRNVLSEAKNCAKNGQYEKALGFVNDILLHDPGNVEALFVRGGIYLKLGHPKMAADSWTKILCLHPGHEKASRWLKRLEETG